MVVRPRGADHLQIVHALFGSVSFAQRRLLRLLHLGVLARFRPLKPDGGSFPYHWLLDQPGTEVIAAQRGDPLPRPGLARARRLRLTSRANLPHLLGVNGVFTALAAHERTHPGSHLADWQPVSRFTDPGELYQGGDDLVVLSVRVRPDGYGLWTEDGVRVGFFVEYDTGTGPLPVLLDKVARYYRLWVGKRHPSPVLFVLPTALRELHLHQRLADRVPPGGVPVATTSTDLWPPPACRRRRRCGGCTPTAVAGAGWWSCPPAVTGRWARRVGRSGWRATAEPVASNWPAGLGEAVRELMSLAGGWSCGGVGVTAPVW